MLFIGDVTLNDMGNANELQTNVPPRPERRHPAVLVLLAVLLLELAALAAAALFFVVELFVATPTSMASAVGITVLIAAGAVWIGFIVVGILRGQSWTRAATVVVQVLLGAIAVGSLQGPAPRVDLGLAVLVPAVLALVLLFSKPVVAATANREDDPRTF